MSLPFVATVTRPLPHLTRAVTAHLHDDVIYTSVPHTRREVWCLTAHHCTRHTSSFYMLAIQLEYRIKARIKLLYQTVLQLCKSSLQITAVQNIDHTETNLPFNH